MQSKATLRLHYQALRDAIPASDRRRYNPAIHEELIQQAVFQRARRVLAYCTFRSEVDTLPILSFALEQGKSVHVPRLTDQYGIMEVVPIRQLEDLQPGTFGIPEPNGTLPPTDDYAFDLLLLPGLAFDHLGNRLGYGGGYFDRMLAKPTTTGFRIGLGYHIQYVAELPVETFDQQLDGVITERGFFPTLHE